MRKWVGEEPASYQRQTRYRLALEDIVDNGNSCTCDSEPGDKPGRGHKQECVYRIARDALPRNRRKQ